MTIIHAVLRRLHSPDVDDLEAFSPSVPDHFGILVQALFGPEGVEGEESFDFLVCTPAWLAEKARRVGVVSGRYHLIVHAFDLPQLRAFLDGCAKSASGKSWKVVAAKLARIGQWEFEDYVP
ncbi:MAG: immunity 8 family protein [Labrys sp. (in: a-proteobacteria)]